MVGLLALVAAAPLGCHRPDSQGSGAERTADSPQVILYPAGGGAPWPVHVELAKTEREQERGLMFRRSLDADAGMLFLFAEPALRRFWMRNCYISLDMIFLDQDKGVVGIEERTIPGDDTGRGPNRPAQYVIEVAGGLARSHGISVGSRVEFRNVK